MPSSNPMDVLRLVLGMVFLGIASYTDLRTRKVVNELWLIMLAAGLVVMEIDLLVHGADWILLLAPAPITIFFFAILSEGEIVPDHISVRANRVLTLALNILAVVILWFMGVRLGYDDRWIRILHVPLMLVVAYLFYLTGLLHGGADAKALMGLAVLVPFYPSIEGLPQIVNLEAITLILPFTFVILVDSALVTLFVPLGMALLNVTRGDIDLRMFFGYRLPLGKVAKHQVWLMEKVRDGEVVTFLVPKRGERGRLKKEILALKKAGVDRVWVNPKIPFMVPMFIGFIISFLIGNLVMGLMESLMGL